MCIRFSISIPVDVFRLFPHFSKGCVSVAPRRRRVHGQRQGIETEMRLVLKAMDTQKTVTSRNMQQLGKMYEEWLQE